MASICGRVCAHPCETACRRGEIDKPIAIRALKRFLTERHGPESRHPIDVNAGRTQPKLPFRIAIVGAGPVGLSAAHDLALMGYAVTIFEASQVPGGMLYLGLPEYRLSRDVVEAQVREILATGDITLKLNHAAGRDFAVADLRRDFDAVLIAVGAHRSRDLTIPGVNLDGVYKGIDFLLNVNLGYRFTIGKKVLVIGGGNVAMDVARSAAREVLRQHAGGVENFEPSQGSMDAVAAREMMDVSLSALRLGAQEVHLVCLENRAEMPAALEEIEEAEEEGIIIHPGFGPKQIIGENGRAVALEVLKTKSVFDANRRFSPPSTRTARRAWTATPSSWPSARRPISSSSARRWRGCFAARPDRGEPANADDLGQRRVRRRRLRLRSAPHHRQRGRWQARGGGHRRVPARDAALRSDCGSRSA
jgi:formate dehydrogenase beta subunit